jgi:hypothetical protein
MVNTVTAGKHIEVAGVTTGNQYGTKYQFISQTSSHLGASG